jgi:hypothetical protein
VHAEQRLGGRQSRFKASVFPWCGSSSCMCMCICICTPLPLNLHACTMHTCTFAFAYICIHLHSHLHAGVCKWPWEVPVGQVLVEGDISQTAQVRDEPGSGGVRVGQTRSDLDCRVVATSRRVAPTGATVDSPFLAAARRVASDSSTPGHRQVQEWYSTRRAARLVCRDLSPRQSPTRQTNVARGLWPNSSDSSDEDVTTRRDSSD